jgi:hypothetical protein
MTGLRNARRQAARAEVQRRGTPLRPRYGDTMLLKQFSRTSFEISEASRS